MSVSYANIAAQGTAEEPAPAKPAPVADSVAGESVAESKDVKDVKDTKDASDAEPAVSADAAAAATSAPAKKEKKSLAPAPVPTKSAWGAAPASSSASNGTSVVDEHKWPTPDQGPQLDNQAGSKNYQQKFIKPITNKWVPISAKVILPSPRNNNQKQNRNRKNKAPAKNPSSASTPSKKVPAQQISKKEGGDQEADQEGEVPADAEAHVDGADLTSIPPASTEESNGQDPSLNNINGYQNGQYSSNYNPQYQKFNPANGQQKNFRRYNNGPNGQQYNKRYNQPVPQGQQVQGQSQPQNGFYHPQPFVQNQNYQNFNNRQFRPQNGQFRPHNRNYRNNGYRNGMMPQMGGMMNPMVPQQPQIPPPISPKQDPQQALTQQIDYYFSLENLIRDIYLRKNMGAEGWVPLSLILNFKRVKIIINGIQNSLEADQEVSSIILETVKNCQNLEVKYINEKDAESSTIDDVNLRVKDNFEQWLLPVEN